MSSFPVVGIEGSIMIFFPFLYSPLRYQVSMLCFGMEALQVPST